MSRKLAAVTDEFLMLLTETAEFHGGRHPEVSRMLLQAAEVAAGIRRRLSISTDRYVIATVGLTNVGKSTLLNALLGEPLAPLWNGPCTAFPIEFISGTAITVTAHYRGTFNRPTWDCRTPTEVVQRLDRLTRDNPSAYEDGLAKVVVKAPLPILGGGIVIADTPGFGAVQFGAAEGSHEKALREYLNDKVAQVFWVVRAEQAISKREKDFYEALLCRVCDDIIVTGCEDWTPEDHERFRRRYGGEFGNRFVAFHFVSGRQGLEARKANDAAGLAASGVGPLEERFRAMGHPERRAGMIRRRAVALARDLGVWAAEYRDDRSMALTPRWRPDSWARLRAVCGDDDTGRQLVSFLTAEATGEGQRE